MNTNIFYPAVAFISGLTQAQNAVVTFTANHEFTVGENIGFRVTKPFGMFEINQQIGLVTAITPNTVTVNIDTLNYTPFTYALINTAGTTPPCCVPSSSGVAPGQVVPTVNLADAFDNRP